MAAGLLCKKGVNQPLGVNYVQKYIKRHPEWRSKYVPSLDKERASAEDPKIIGDWFQLYAKTLKDYNIQPETPIIWMRKGS